MLAKDYELILYDLDGTIWDSIPLIMSCFKHAYVEVTGRCDRTDEDLMSYIGKPLTDTFAMHDEKTAKALLDSYLTYNHMLLEQDVIPMFPGVADSLNRIKAKGIRQGVVTSKRIYSAGVTLKLLGGLYSGYVPAYSGTVVTVLDGSDATVGDAMPDALCAGNAGAKFALVSWSSMDKEAIMAAAPEGSVVIGSLKELVN